MSSTLIMPAEQPEPEHYPRYTTTDDTYVHGLYHDALEEPGVEECLATMEEYNFERKRWMIPEPLASVETLVDALFTIVSSVMKRFGKAKEPGVERTLVDTRELQECAQIDESGYKACPMLMVHATGPSFQIPKHRRDKHGAAEPELFLGYPGMATFIIATLDADAGDADEQVDEMETYARRILHDQPNRSFVRALFLTETRARLAHFDRSGAEITPLFGIHEHPATFVRIIAGISSADERIIGFDTSILWSIFKGRKSDGTLTTTGPNGKPRTYRILGQLRTPRKEIRGRATTCWRVQDPDTLEELLVKDSWRPYSRRGEYELLESVKGIPGVVQMSSYEIGRGETKDFRCPSTFGYFQNCVATRVTTRLYGRSIAHFTSALQLLCALRDAIAAHRKLVSDEIQILHRDIAPQNLLLGKVDAPEGDRGVLIDFDLAFKATPECPTTKADHTIGVRIFQSLSILASEFKSPTKAHDYLDDLQSFFYVLVYILVMYRPDGSPHPSTEDGPTIMSSWNQDSAGDSYFEKEGILGCEPVRFHVSELIDESWGPICDELYKTFRAWSASRRTDKERLECEGKNLDDLLSRREEHYTAVLAMFDDAIKATYASAGTFAPEHPCPPSEPAPQQPAPAPQPRRSARLNDVRPKKQPQVCSSTAKLNPAPSAPQPRRSARLQKRRLDHEQREEPDAPRAKLRRITRTKVTRATPLHRRG